MVEHKDGRVAEGVDKLGVRRDGGGGVSGGVSSRCGKDVSTEALAAAKILTAATAVTVREAAVKATAAMAKRWRRWLSVACGRVGVCGRACGWA